MNFTEKLRKLRKESGLSQEQLATQIGVSRQALSKWELGTALPDTENALRLSKFFGVSIDDLLNDESDTERVNPAVQIKNHTLSTEYRATIRVLAGTIVSFLAAVGLVVIGILSSVYPTYNTFPMEIIDGGTNGTVVKTGLPAFLELHNIGWLFEMCIVLVPVGMHIAVYPKVLSRATCLRIKRYNDSMQHWKDRP